MPNRGERTKNKKFRRLPHGKSRVVFERDHPGKHHCTLCGAVLHGVPHGRKPSEVRKMGKTERRPSARFAGMLCGKCRATVFVEAAKVGSGLKKIQDVELRLREFTAQVKVE